MEELRCIMFKGDSQRVMKAVGPGCTKPKRPNNSEWFKEKMFLVRDLESRAVLDEEQMAFLEDNRDAVTTGQGSQELTTQAIFQTDDLDAFDSNCDEAPSASVVLMAKLSAYDSNVLSEVPSHDINLDHNVFDNNVHELQYYEKPSFIDDSNIESTSDSGFHGSSSSSSTLGAGGALSKGDNKLLTTTVDVLKKEMKEKEDKYLDEIIALEKKKKALDKIVYKMVQSTQTLHMLKKPQVFYDDNHKTALGYQNPLYLTKA
ncbi:hypothetical protein Tco_1058410 [Tanacetum coccineum]|uniref:Retrovirus-related Pol polyprotein from transposon TNT 1-94 n=1 Tax=Tanacetum coccineum TaxID=301880 RepID=A0ABQ5HA75_9ASTR